jgi:hypothetical protein
MTPAKSGKRSEHLVEPTHIAYPPEDRSSDGSLWHGVQRLDRGFHLR